jgi:DNA-binding transcriptional ArsR family regulator
MIGDGPYKALADPTRRQILRLLAQGELTAGEISERFHQTPATLSHHLSVLKEAGLATVERRGKRMVYAANATVIQSLIADLIDAFQIELEDKKRP